MLALLATLSLSLSNPVAEPLETKSFEPTLLDGSAGDLNEARPIAFLVLGTAVTGAMVLANLPLFVIAAELFPPLLVLPLAAITAVLRGVSYAFDVQSGWGSAAVGAVVGVTAGVLLGWGFAVLSDSGVLSFEAIVGLILGTAVISPLVTLFDPIGRLTGGRDGGDVALLPEARPSMRVEERRGDTRRLTLLSARF